MLFVEVVAKTVDAKMSRCYFAENDTELFCVRVVAREARLFFLVQPIKFLICDIFVVADVQAKHSKLSRVMTCEQGPTRASINRDTTETATKTPLQNRT